MTILIVEDEKPAANRLKQLLKKIDASIVIVDAIETVEGCINWLQLNDLPDLILMDIQLGDGICFEIFDVIKINTPIIFTTAYDEYVMRAFKVNGIDYLLKPVDPGGLAAAMNKYNSLFAHEKTAHDKIKQVYNDWVKDYKTRFLIKSGSQYNSVLTSDIECFYVRDQYTYLRTFAGKKYDLEYSLQQLESIISPEHFFRVNRNYIVHINAISKILSYSANRLRVIINSNSTEELIVSREKVTDFKKWLDK